MRKKTKSPSSSKQRQQPNGKKPSSNHDHSLHSSSTIIIVATIVVAIGANIIPEQYRPRYFLVPFFSFFSKERYAMTGGGECTDERVLCYNDDDDDDDDDDDNDNDDDDDNGNKYRRINPATIASANDNHNMNVIPDDDTLPDKNFHESIITTTTSPTSPTTTTTTTTTSTTTTLDIHQHQQKAHLTPPLTPRTSPLLPSHLPPPHLFSSWDPPLNSSFPLPPSSSSFPGKQQHQTVARGWIAQQWDPTSPTSVRTAPRSKFTVLPGVVPRNVVGDVLSLLRFGRVVEGGGDDNGGMTAVPLDTDPDTVDGMTTQEIFLDNDSLRAGHTSKGSSPNPIQDEPNYTQRTTLRSQIRSLLDPILDDIITPFVRTNHPDKCSSSSQSGRECTPCYSLIRRYRAGERISHAPHHDRHSLLTVVVSLSDYGTEYEGGLYITTKSSRKSFLGLDRGDAVIHGSDLLHGVQIMEWGEEEDDERHKQRVPERWSWILWYRDSITCEDHSSTWHAECAAEGNPTCQALHAGKGGGGGGGIEHDHRLACTNGYAPSCVKLSRAYLGTLPSDLIPEKGGRGRGDVPMAKTLLERAVVLSDDPDGHYGLAVLSLMEITNDTSLVEPDHPAITLAITHLEHSAYGGNPYAMFNLGLAAALQYAEYARIPRLYAQAIAAEWFAKSGLPEGYYAVALHSRSLGRMEEAEEFRRRAWTLGWGSRWRVGARERTGTGGAGGVDLNMPWPRLVPDGRKPPVW